MSPNSGRVANEEPAERRLQQQCSFRPGDKVLLYDGVCNLCNGWVNFVLARDARARYKFAALQGEVGRAMMTQVGRDPDDLSTLVLIELPLQEQVGPTTPLPSGRATAETVYDKSEAVLRVVEDVSGPVLGTAARLARQIIPTAVRDFVYSHIVAPNRYLVFGKSNQCQRITAAMRPRFPDLDPSDSGRRR